MDWKSAPNGDLQAQAPGAGWGVDGEILVVARMSDGGDTLSAGQERAAQAVLSDAERLFSKLCGALEHEAEMEVEIAWRPDDDEGGEAESVAAEDALPTPAITTRFSVSKIQLPADDEVGILIVEGPCDWDEDGFMIALNA